MKKNIFSIKKNISETLEEKADYLLNKIKKSEMEEEYGDMPGLGDGTSRFDSSSYKKVNLKDLLKNINRDSLTPEEDEIYDIDLEDELYGDDEDLDPYISGEEDLTEELEEGKMCEQCGSGLNEGDMCEQCGYKGMEEGIYDVDDLDDSNEFDYVEEIEEEEDMESSVIRRQHELCSPEPGNKKYDAEACKYHTEIFGLKQINESKHKRKIGMKKLEEKWKGEVDVEKTGEYADMTIEEINAAIKKLKKQNEKYQEEGKKVPVKNREKMSELYFAKRAKQGWKGKGKAAVEEGNEFTGALAKAKEEGKKSFEVGGKTYPVKESIQYVITDHYGDEINLNENELIDLIEKVVMEQKQEGLRTIGKPKGLTVYEKAHKGSGKENQDYLKSVTKKMKDYLKDGSKGEYSMEPKMFPQGNGQLEKMSKKAYVPSNAVQDYIDNFTAAGLENLDYDGIEPNEEWVSDLVKGSSRTGNNPKWANAVETGVNTKRDKIRKDNLLAQVKKKAYNKAPQPIVKDKTGEDEGDKILRQLESLEPKKSKQINEEFDRMKQLLGYNRKTQ